MKVEIRKARKKDVDSILALLKEFRESAYREIISPSHLPVLLVP
jgi:N-acetylglutamate synthase-like GNAT family acetyltransferase